MLGVLQVPGGLVQWRRGDGGKSADSGYKGSPCHHSAAGHTIISCTNTDTVYGMDL